MHIRKVLLVMMACIAVCSCSSMYTFSAGAYPSNIAPHETGWTYLAQVSINDKHGVPHSTPAPKRCFITVIDQNKKKLLSHEVKVFGGALEQKIEWQEGPLLLVRIYSPDSSSASPIYEASFQYVGGIFKQVPPNNSFKADGLQPRP